MPLDDIARRYANTLFVDKMEKLAQGFQQVSAETRAALLKRGLTEHNSGQYHSEMARVGINYIADLAQAKADSLVSAYERAAIPFDDDAVAEVSREVVEYCEAQGINLARNLEENARRAGMHSGVGSQLASTIRASVTGIEARIRRQLSAKRDEQILDSRKRPESVGAERSEWDVFISHATEDKADFVRPLAEALKAIGLRVWYDEFELRVGDHLRRSIDRGLARSRYGVVVLSPSFFAKHWPQTELDGLVAREVGGEKVILPVWHKIDFAGVREYSPTLAERVAARSSDGLEKVVASLSAAMSVKWKAGTEKEAEAHAAGTAAITSSPVHLTKGARVRITPVIPREHEQSEFMLTEDAGEYFVFQKTDSHRSVDIPKSFIDNIHKFGDPKPALLQLSGRLQWVSTKRNFELFPDKPPAGPAGAYGIGKDVDSNYPAKLGVQGKFGREDRLLEILGRGWLIFYDTDGTYLRWGNQVFVVDWV